MLMTTHKKFKNLCYHDLWHSWIKKHYIIDQNQTKHFTFNNIHNLISYQMFKQSVLKNRSMCHFLLLRKRLRRVQKTNRFNEKKTIFKDDVWSVRQFRLFTMIYIKKTKIIKDFLFSQCQKITMLFNLFLFFLFSIFHIFAFVAILSSCFLILRSKFHINSINLIRKLQQTSHRSSQTSISFYRSWTTLRESLISTTTKSSFSVFWSRLTKIIMKITSLTQRTWWINSWLDKMRNNWDKYIDFELSVCFSHVDANMLFRCFENDESSWHRLIFRQFEKKSSRRRKKMIIMSIRSSSISHRCSKSNKIFISTRITAETIFSLLLSEMS